MVGPFPETSEHANCRNHFDPDPGTFGIAHVSRSVGGFSRLVGGFVAQDLIRTRCLGGDLGAEAVLACKIG